MSTRIGTDIVEIARVRKMLKKHGKHFIEKVYTDEESQRLIRLKNQSTYLSGRWAAKEAIFKLLAGDAEKRESSQILWKDMSIGEAENGSPIVSLSGKAKQIADELKLEGLKISISHSKDYAIATVIAVSHQEEKTP